MAQLPQSYNSENNKEGMTDFTAMDAGKYPMTIVKSQYKETKAKNGHYLQLQMKVFEGKNKGRMFFENLNLDNPNPVTVEIANKTLNSICQACDKAAVEDSSELHNLPLFVTLKVVPKTATQPPSNDVTKYEPYTEGGVPETEEEQTEEKTSEATPGTKKKLPWE